MNLDELFGEVEKEKNNIVVLDLSNILHSTYYSQVKFDKTLDNEFTKFAMWRYLILNSIQNIRAKFNPDEFIIAIDSGSWRKNEFKYYKGRRKLAREKKNDFEAEEFYKMSEQFINEFKETFPYKFIAVKYAEADDIICVLVDHLWGKNITIVSRDKDFRQLLKNNVKLFDPISKEYIIEENPSEYLFNHIISGDSSDDIPNILSDDDSFMNSSKRQKRLTSKVKSQISEMGIENFVIKENLISNYERNKKMIMLSKETIPKDIWVDIIYQYNQEPTKGNFLKVASFFRKHKIKSLEDKIDKFI